MTEIIVSDFPYSGKEKGDYKLYTLDNGKMSVSVTDYGATLTSIKTPDKNGEMGDIILGYDTVEEYASNGGYIGATIGRYANRIGGARFSLNGESYTLAANDGNNHLHGGNSGFDKKRWNARVSGESVIMEAVSADMEEGYPGKLHISVTFTLSDNNELSIKYYAKSDKDTVLNLTNHSYFNLNCGGDILGHTAKINGSRFTRVDGEAIPTGELPLVEGTPLDFRTPRVIGDRIDLDDADLKAVGGYDHNFVIDGSGMREAAVFSSDKSGRTLTVSTNLPGMQLYAGNMLTKVKGKNGTEYDKRSGFCAETQCYPDAPNQSWVADCVLKKEDEYNSETVLAFGVK